MTNNIGNLSLTKEERSRLKNYVITAKKHNLNKNERRELIIQFEQARLGTPDFDLETAIMSNANVTFHQQLTGGAPIDEYPATWEKYKEMCKILGVDNLATESELKTDFNDEALRQQARTINKRLLSPEDSIAGSFLPRYIVRRMGKYRVPLLANCARYQGPFSKQQAEGWLKNVMEFSVTFRDYVNQENQERLARTGELCQTALQEQNYTRHSMSDVLNVLYQVLDTNEISNSDNIIAEVLKIYEPSNSKNQKEEEFDRNTPLKLVREGITNLAGRYGGITHTYTVRKNAIGELHELADRWSAAYVRLKQANPEEKKLMAKVAYELVNDYDPIVRANAVNILMLTDGENALPIYKRMAKDPNPLVRETLVTHLPSYLPDFEESHKIAKQIIKDEKHQYRHKDLTEKYETYIKMGIKRAEDMAKC